MLSQTRPHAVLWDFDGTVADTEPLWIASQIEIMGSYGVTCTYDQIADLCGVSEEDSLIWLLDAYQAQRGEPFHMSGSELWAEIVAEVIRRLDEIPLPWRPGAQELLNELQDRAVPMALVSASPRLLIDTALAKMRPGVFDVVIAGDEMPRSKPAPDSYLLAAQRLGVCAADCIVMEDTISGTAAGRASGAVVIAVPCIQELDEYPGQLLTSTLDGLSVDELSRVWYQVKGIARD